MTPALLLVVALSTAQAKEPISIVPSSVEHFTMGLTGGSFDVIVSATRTGCLPLKLRELDYEIMVAGKRFATGTTTYKKMVIKKDTPTTIPIHVKFTTRQALSAGIAAMSGKKLRVRVKGEADVSVLFFPFTIPFNERLD
ncbi:MAG: LEA type 2 family protein [Deltaproteobacteria bacterium]|jgi:hypothetical protein|nr:LEA type 2 family protein [Deltaproteobacteria bacterium]